MSDLQEFIGEDSRMPIQRLRRCQLWKEADRCGLQYPPGASKDVMIKLFEANSIDVTQSPDVKWQVLNGRDVDGNPRQELYPVEQQPASIRNGVNASLVLSERLSAKEEEEKGFKEARLGVLEKENAQLRLDNERITKMMEERLAALESKPADPDSSPANPYWAKYRKAREMGLNVDRNMKLPQIEAAIEKAEQANG